MRRFRYQQHAAVGGFSPDQEANLAAWFRYGQGITSASNAVSQWNDASGNGRHLKQATGSAQPALQGDGSILFDGTSDFLKCDAFTLVQPETIYLLAKQVTWTNGDRLFDGDAAASGALIQSNVAPQLDLNAGSTIGANTDLAVDTYGVISVVFNGASSRLQINNLSATTGNAGAANMGGFTLGTRGAAGILFAHIQVKEVILYAAAHDAATRAKVIAYLAGVGGLSL